MAMHTELWFPSVIWSATTHVVNNHELMEFAYQKKAADKGRVISNHGGWQSSDIVANECKEVDRLVNYLNTEINECATQVGLKDLQIYNLWININPTGSYNHLHNHVGAVFSGVYYVHAEDYQGNIQFERNDGAEYHIPESIDKATYYTSTRASYKAKTGAIYIFPGWLKHSVEGNQTQKDRISISFNYGEKK